jgi:hypothetical protein
MVDLHLKDQGETKGAKRFAGLNPALTEVSFGVEPNNEPLYFPLAFSPWSGRRDSNSQQLAWKARALPIELRPH